MIDLLISFDTTGSMYPCLTEVRRRVSEMCTRLFNTIPDLQIGVIAHGDYCDRYTTYVTQHLPFTGSQNITRVVNFINQVTKTNGCDLPECYELVLKEARDFEWRPDSTRVMVLIGDDVPHSVHDSQNHLHLNWETELKSLVAGGVKVYPVQCLARRHATPFYERIASISGTYHLPLAQFSDIVELITAISLQQVDENRLIQYREELHMGLKLNRNLNHLFDRLLGKSYDTPTRHPPDLQAVPPHRFQVLHVDNIVDIKGFVLSTGAEFRIGRGFYQFTKPEMVQERKEVVLRNKITGDMFTGDKAREMIGLPYGRRGHIRPVDLDEYDIYVQSTSYNRKLLPNTQFLYEVKDWDL